MGKEEVGSGEGGWREWGRRREGVGKEEGESGKEEGESGEGGGREC